MRKKLRKCDPPIGPLCCGRPALPLVPLRPVFECEECEATFDKYAMFSIQLAV